MTTPRIRNNSRLRELPKDQHVIAGGNKVVVAAEYTRPANTTAYTALDAISDDTSAAAVHALAFPGVGVSGYIVGARITTTQNTCTETFRLHLYRSQPTPIVDNSPFTNLYANNANRIGQLSFGAAAAEGSGSTAAEAILTAGSGNVPMPYVTKGGDLYGLLEAVGGFTPASGQQFYVELVCEVD